MLESVCIELCNHITAVLRCWTQIVKSNVIHAHSCPLKVIQTDQTSRRVFDFHWCSSCVSSMEPPFHPRRFTDIVFRKWSISNMSILNVAIYDVPCMDGFWKTITSASSTIAFSEWCVEKKVTIQIDTQIAIFPDVLESIVNGLPWCILMHFLASCTSHEMQRYSVNKNKSYQSFK